MKTLPFLHSLSPRLRRATLLATIAATLSACAVVRDQQSVGAYIDDATITAKIKASMAQDEQVAATAISVETLNGVTQLSGFAKSPTEKERAGQIARQTEGVRNVRNDIVVRP